MLTKKLVGGAVRDLCDKHALTTKEQVETFLETHDMGKEFAHVHDLDWVVECGSMDEMREGLLAEGCKIFTEKPDHATIRVSLPKDHVMRVEFGVKDADFVMARQDGPSSDGRHADFVLPGTINQDLARRDFTVNAMAIDLINNTFTDNHGGLSDLANGRLRFVGDAMQRIEEDGLRVLRTFRFTITKNLTPTPYTWAAVTSPLAAEMLARPAIHVNRIREELNKMHSHDTIRAGDLIASLPMAHKKAIWRDGLWSKASLEQK
jgi:tRNA nucleotidyltransferase/poly(A) polymerase